MRNKKQYKIVVSPDYEGIEWDFINQEYSYNIFLSYHNTIRNDNELIKEFDNFLSRLTEWYDDDKEAIEEYKEVREDIKEFEKSYNIFTVDIYTHSDSVLESWEHQYLSDNLKTMELEEAIEYLENMQDKIVITSKEITELNYFQNAFNGESYNITLFEIVECPTCSHTDKYCQRSELITTDERDEIIKLARDILKEEGVSENHLTEPVESFEVVF